MIAEPTRPTITVALNCLRHSKEILDGPAEHEEDVLEESKWRLRRTLLRT